MSGYNQIKLIIVEDEWVIAKYIKQILNDNFKNVIICEECKTVEHSVNSIKEHKPEIVLFDVELSDGTSFDVIDQTKDLHFEKIFITSYSQYAIKAIKNYAIDYILKPINERELIKSIERCIEIIKQREILTLNELNLNEVDKKKVSDSYLEVNKKKERFLIKYSKIVYIKSDNTYTQITYLNNNTLETVKSTIAIKKMETILANSFFLRVHNRYIINTHFFKNINGEMKDTVHQITIPISPDKLKSFKTRIL